MAAREPRSGAPHLRRVGAVLLLALTLFIGWQAPWAERLQAAWFDALQTRWSRQVDTLPVVVVAIDQKSLVELGQWPWPRRLLAQLVQTLNRAQPAAIGINILMPESDALSPERLLAHSQVDDARLVDVLRSLPTHDAQLARAMSMAPTVLVVAGTQEATGTRLRAPPVTVQALRRNGALPDPPETLSLPRYDGALTSIDELDSQADGWGLISVDTSRGLVRRMPLVASIGGTLAPALAVEMLRVAERSPSLRLAVSGSRIDSVNVGRVKLPTEADGAVRVYFSPHLDQRFVSAADVIAGRVDDAAFHGRLVLVGLTAVGLQDLQNTPIGERMSGTEVHAQLLENLLDGSTLRRPRWAGAAEAAAFAAIGALLLWLAPRWRSYRAALLLVAGVALLLALAALAFRAERLLFDPVTPSLMLAIFFSSLLALSLTENTRQTRRLQRVVQTQREASARIAGELRAAQQVQTATLPRAETLHGDARVDLHATLEPAREVGGDLYDFFLLDERRLFLLVGDVAGKGLSASIFMAVSKALAKSVMLRSPDAHIGRVMADVNTEVSRDNPGELFVTAFAAIIDLDSGEMHYCNAGHDNPYLLHPDRAEPARVEGGDGPPLCATPDWDYRGSCCRLQPGETLCLFTDGVTEAQTARHALYGSERLHKLFTSLQPQGLGARALVEAVHADVMGFAAGAEPADDLTILALRWIGPK